MQDGGDSKPLPLFLLTITPLSAFENKQSAFQFLRQPSFTLLKPSDSSPNKPTGETNKISHRDLRPSCPRSPVPPAAPARRGQAPPRAPPPAAHPRSSRVPIRHGATAVSLARLRAARSRTRVRPGRSRLSEEMTKDALLRPPPCPGRAGSCPLQEQTGVPGQCRREVVRNPLERQSRSEHRRCSWGCPPAQSLCRPSAESSSALNSRAKYTQQHTGASQHCQIMFVLHFKPLQHAVTVGRLAIQCYERTMLSSPWSPPTCPWC